MASADSAWRCVPPDVSLGTSSEEARATRLALATPLLRTSTGAKRPVGLTSMCEPTPAQQPWILGRFRLRRSSCHRAARWHRYRGAASYPLAKYRRTLLASESSSTFPLSSLRRCQLLLHAPLVRQLPMRPRQASPCCGADCRRPDCSSPR